jgi:hypothetical protein
VKDILFFDTMAFFNGVFLHFEESRTGTGSRTTWSQSVAFCGSES